MWGQDSGEEDILDKIGLLPFSVRCTALSRLQCRKYLALLAPIRLELPRAVLSDGSRNIANGNANIGDEHREGKTRELEQTEYPIQLYPNAIAACTQFLISIRNIFAT